MESDCALFAGRKQNKEVFSFTYLSQPKKYSCAETVAYSRFVAIIATCCNSLFYLPASSYSVQWWDVYGVDAPSPFSAANVIKAIDSLLRFKELDFFVTLLV